MSEQTRFMSLIESVANTAVGFCLSLALQFMLCAYLKVETTAGQNILMSGVFTLASLARGYLMRRLFLRWEKVRD